MKSSNWSYIETLADQLQRSMQAVGFISIRAAFLAGYKKGTSDSRNISNSWRKEPHVYNRDEIDVAFEISEEIKSLTDEEVNEDS